MITLIKRKSIRSLILATIFVISFLSPLSRSVDASISYSIELQEFRWDQFPLTVLVDMNEWSLPEYATSVREALDSWGKSIWNYTHSYTNMTLMFNYIFFTSSTNSTQNYDVLVTFTPYEMPPESNIVGLTKFRWDIATHTAISPTIINVTTYSATADQLFIKNVVMHEFGHALGLGHASSESTSDGPELMYYSSTNTQIVFPSTLDVFGLITLYSGSHGQSVQLPTHIPYIMLGDGSFPSLLQPSPLYALFPSTNVFQYLLHTPEKIWYQPFLLLVPCILWIVIALIVGVVFRSGSQGVIATIAISIIIAYFTSNWNRDLVLLSLKLTLLLPGIVLGAFSGGYIGRNLSKKSVEPEISGSYPDMI
jgi:hypothetical protein